MNGADVGMIERGEELRFTLEPGEPIGVGGEEIRQYFQGDVPTELSVARAVDFAHPAGTEQCDDLVWTNV